MMCSVMGALTLEDSEGDPYMMTPRMTRAERARAAMRADITRCLELLGACPPDDPQSARQCFLSLALILARMLARIDGPYLPGEPPKPPTV